MGYKSREELNEYVLKVEGNEWTFKEEIWEAIEALLIEARIDEVNNLLDFAGSLGDIPTSEALGRLQELKKKLTKGTI